MPWLVVWHFVVHWTGSDYGAPYGQFQPYDFLSGLAGLSLIGILYSHIRSHNCHQPRCWRIGRLPVEGTPWKTCRRHHPDPPQPETIRKHYHLYLGKQPGDG
jgi:hypothetical protein